MHDLDRTLETEDAFELQDAELDPEIFTESEVSGSPRESRPHGARAPAAIATEGRLARRFTGRWIRRGHTIVLLGV
jgi:hypothetical protein